MCWWAVPQLLWIDVLPTTAHTMALGTLIRITWCGKWQIFHFHLQLQRAEACDGNQLSPAVKSGAVHNSVREALLLSERDRNA